MTVWTEGYQVVEVMRQASLPRNNVVKVCRRVLARRYRAPMSGFH